MGFVAGLIGFGAVGVLVRWMLGNWLGGMSFPWAILLVNCVGSFAIGALWALPQSGEAARWVSMITVGGLGALTTFSSFALDTVRFAMNGSWGLAAANFVANNTASLTLCYVGYRVGATLMTGR